MNIPCVRLSVLFETIKNTLFNLVRLPFYYLNYPIFGINV